MGMYETALHIHDLELKNYRKPYMCDGCKEPGIGPRYRCDMCDFDLHKDCMFAHSFSPTRHQHFRSSTFEFLHQPPMHRGSRSCDACGKKVKGYVYHCREDGWDLHPCCHKLPLKLDIKSVEFTLRDKVSSKCLWCKKRNVKGSVSGIRGWSYVSECNEYHFHVHCAMEMMLEGWKKGAFDHGKDKGEYDGGGDGDKNDNKLMVLQNLELPIQAYSSRRGRRGNKFVSIVKLFFKTIISILLGDPTAIVAHVLVELIAK